MGVNGEHRDESRRVSLLSNHGHVLMCIAEEPEARVRDIASRAGLSERAAYRIVGDLEASGFVSHTRIGRRNRYRLREGVRGIHELERHLEVADIVPSPVRNGAMR